MSRFAENNLVNLFGRFGDCKALSDEGIFEKGFGFAKDPEAFGMGAAMLRKYRHAQKMNRFPVE